MTVAIVLHRADGAPVATSFRRAAFGKDDPFVAASRNRLGRTGLDDRGPNQLHW